MNIADTCSVSFTWLSDIDSAFITKYRICEDKSLLNSDTSQSNDDEEFEDQNFITLTVDAAHEELHCVMNVVAKKEYNVTIAGLSVMSSSRNQEFYSDKIGYIKTVRGSQLTSASGSVVYHSTCHTSQALDNLSVKFLSLKDHSSFKIYSIKIYVKQGTNADRNGIPSQPGIDVTKLKQYMKDSELNIPDAASPLLNSIEQYQKNQSQSMEEIGKMLNNTSIPEEKRNTMSQLQGMLSSFARISQQQKMTNGAVNSFSSPSNMPPNGSGDGKHGLSFDFLKSVCSEVTKMREQKHVESSDEKPTSASTSLSPEDTSSMKNFIEKEIADSEKRILDHVDKKLMDMELMIGRKTDIILNLLTTLALQKSPAAVGLVNDSTMITSENNVQFQKSDCNSQINDISTVLSQKASVLDSCETSDTVNRRTIPDVINHDDIPLEPNHSSSANGTGITTLENIDTLNAMQINHVTNGEAANIFTAEGKT